MTDPELEKMFALTDKLLAPYYNGIEEGEKRERERIREALAAEQKRSGLGFIQYKVLLALIGEEEDK
jgi:hypothetical protein